MNKIDYWIIRADKTSDIEVSKSIVFPELIAVNQPYYIFIFSKLQGIAGQVTLKSMAAIVEGKDYHYTMDNYSEFEFASLHDIESTSALFDILNRNSQFSSELRAMKLSEVAADELNRILANKSISINPSSLMDDYQGKKSKEEPYDQDPDDPEIELTLDEDKKKQQDLYKKNFPSGKKRKEVEKVLPQVPPLNPTKQLTTTFRKACGYFHASPNKEGDLSSHHLFFALVEQSRWGGIKKWVKEHITEYDQVIKEYFPHMENRPTSYQLNLQLPELKFDSSIIRWTKSAQKAQGEDSKLGQRHYWQAFIDDEELIFSLDFQFLDFDLPGFRELVEGAVLELPPIDKKEDDIDEEEKGEPKNQISTYSFDGLEGPDKIGIEAEALAFSKLFLSTQVKPPLSVAVFGYWGSGKSFFMKQIRKFSGEIADEMKGMQGTSDDIIKDKEAPYHDQIVHIEFNAWHYMETNLWASLVSHIFTELNENLDKQLKGTEEKKREKMRERFFQQLTTAKELQLEAEEQEAQLIAKRVRHKKDMDLNQWAKGRQASKRSEVQSQDLFAAVKQTLFPEGNTNSNEEFQEAAKKLGISDLANSLKEVHAQGKQAQNLIGRGQVLVSSLTHLPGGSWFWLAALIVGVPLLFSGLAYLIPKNNEVQFNEFVVSIGGILASFSVWLKKGLDIGTKAMDKLDEFRANLDNQLVEQQQQQELEIAQIDTKLAEIESDLCFCRVRYNDALQAADTARADIINSSAINLLRNFIQDRAKGETYSKHLSLISTIRRDFEELSKLMRQRREDSWGDEDKEVISAVKAIPQVDRIILYIDDLDRCPERKVVDVLQAIHLLLSFELFVVVVAVDERWLSGSLIKKYKNLVDEKDGDIKEGSASAYDYLEKIFQVPYWVPVMNKKAQDDVIEGLIPEGERLLTGKVEPKPSKAAQKSNTTHQPAQAGTMGAGEANAVAGFTPPDETSQNQERNGEPKTPESLQLSTFEINSIKALNPVFAQSPRRSKRFLNCYRLIKASLRDLSQEELVGGQGARYEYRAILFLLAVFVRKPILASSIQKELENEQLNSFEVFHKALPDSDQEAFEQILTLVKEWLSQLPDEAHMLKQMQQHVSLVRRFSFGAAHQELN